MADAFSANDEVFYAGSQDIFDNGDKLTYGSTGTIVDVTGERCGVKFEGNKGIIRVNSKKLSRTQPPVDLPGDFKIDEEAYFAGSCKQFDNGDPLEYGQKGVVQGPSGDGDGELSVRFAGHKQNAACTIAELCKTVPPALAGGFAVHDVVFFKGSGANFENGERLIYGGEGTIAGPGGIDGHRESEVAVRFDGNKMLISVIPEDLCKEPPSPDLPGGFRVNDPCFYLGSSQKLASGDIVSYGAEGHVMGLTRGRVAVWFAGPKHLSLGCATENISKTAPEGELPGGFALNDQVFYKGCNEDLNNGDTLGYGKEGTVVGAKDAKVSVQFPGNKGVIKVNPPNLSKESPPAELAGGFQAGEVAFYSGSGQDLDGGDVLVYGAKGTIAGPAGENSVAWRDAEKRNKKNVNLDVNKVSRTAPAEELAGGYRVGDKVYYVSCNDVLTGGDKLTYGNEGVVKGPSGDGSRVAVFWKGNRENVGSVHEKIGREQPPSQLAGGYVPDDVVYYTSTPQSWDNGDKLEQGGEGVVAGPSGAEKLSVRFAGNKALISLKPDVVSKTKP